MTTRDRFSAFNDPFFIQQPSALGQPSENIQGGSPFGGNFSFQQPTPLNQPRTFEQPTQLQNNRGLTFEEPTQLEGQAGNPFIDFLEEEPNLAFQSALQRGNLTPNQLQFFQNQRGQFTDRFEGLLGQQIQQGQLPNLRFNDFINNVDLFMHCTRMKFWMKKICQ